MSFAASRDLRNQTTRTSRDRKGACPVFDPDALSVTVAARGVSGTIGCMATSTPLGPRPWVIAETNWRDLRATTYDVAVLPWGATESHGHHLPYATDNFEAQALAIEAARLAWDAGSRVAVLPGIPFGVQTGQLDLPFCINLMPSTQTLILADILASLASSGVRKFVLVNGHGGNDFRQILRELAPRFPRLFLSTLNWFGVDDGRSIVDVVGDHADERETSLMLHLEPHLVLPRETWGEGKSNAWRLDALNRKLAWSPREWTKATIDTGVGDPRAATAEKGRAYFDAISRKMADYFIELARVDVDDLYDR